eukprot:5276965-Amphidinium_carterae.1
MAHPQMQSTLHMSTCYNIFEIKAAKNDMLVVEWYCTQGDVLYQNAKRPLFKHDSSHRQR